MASAADKVMQYVERELAKNPDVSNDALLEGAKKIDKSVTSLTPRQFHAKYPLQVKRRSGKPRPKRKTTAKATRRGGGATRSGAPRGRRATRKPSTATNSSAGEDRVRSVMMRFAKDLSSADTQVETIEVLSNLDRYVSDIMKATRN